MTNDQITDSITSIKEDIAAIKEKLSSAHKRIDENDALTARIHELTTSIKTLALEMKIQNEKIEKMLDSFDTRLKAQGVRIGDLEGKSGKRWDAAVEKIIFTIIGALVIFILAKIGI